jgi:hypothetical protein
VEIYSADQLGRSRRAREARASSPASTSGGEQPLGHSGQRRRCATPVHSSPELLDTVREPGRKGLTIQRYKGWAK